eukprot:4111072-Pleurochrysis_carterae.AAC.2
MSEHSTLKHPQLRLITSTCVNGPFLLRQQSRTLGALHARVHNSQPLTASRRTEGANRQPFLIQAS